MVSKETKTLVGIGCVLSTALVMWMSCGDDESSKRTSTSHNNTPAPVPAAPTITPNPFPVTPSGPAPTLPPPPTPLGPAPQRVLSGAYMRHCKSCHGAQGEGPTVLKGTRLQVVEYNTAVRNGRISEGMPAYDASAISSDDLTYDWDVLHSK